MATVDLSVNETQLRETLVNAIKRFSLSYEQHQLVKQSSFGLLVSLIRAKRKPLTIALGMLALFFAYQSGRGFLASSTYLPWFVCAAIAAFWVFRRCSVINALTTAYNAYAHAVGETAQNAGTLGDELRIAFQLDYSESQALHAGNATQAAHSIIARCKANTKNFAKGVVSGYVIMTGIWVVLGVNEFLPLGILLSVGLLACWLVDRSAIAKVQRLLDRYPEADTEPMGQTS